MNFITVDLHARSQIFYFTIHSYFQKTSFANIFKQFAVMTFTSPDQWRKQCDFFPSEFLKNIFYNFFFTKLHHFFAGVVTVCLADTCEEKTEKIINFGNSANGGKRIFIGSFLLNGN